MVTACSGGMWGWLLWTLTQRALSQTLCLPPKAQQWVWLSEILRGFELPGSHVGGVKKNYH